MHIIVRTRLYLCRGVSNVSKFTSNSGIEHWKAVKLILRYLNGTASVGLVCGSKNLDPRISHYSYVFSV